MAWTNRRGSEDNKTRKTKCSHFQESQRVKGVSKGQHMLISAREDQEKRLKEIICKAYTLHLCVCSRRKWNLFLLYFCSDCYFIQYDLGLIHTYTS